MKDVVIVSACRTAIGSFGALAPSGASPASGSVQPTPPRPPVKEGKRPPRLPISDSKTGYVENAIVGTQVRFRDDTAFGIDHPDRAEFFYGKCGCYRPTLDPLAPGPVPDTPSPPTRVIETGISFLDLRLNVEHAFGSRFSWFVEVPFRYLKPEVIDSAFGLADVQTGVKFAVVASDRRYLTLQLKGYLPTGEALHGLGTGHASLEPALLYLDKLSEHLTLETELAYWHPTSGSSADGVFVPTGESSRDSAYLPVASDRFFGDVYGTLKSEVEKALRSGKSMLFDIVVKGGLSIKRKYPDDSLLIFIKPPSIEVLEARLRNRKTEDEETFKRRMARVTMEMGMAPNSTTEVVNDDLQVAIDKVDKLILARTMHSERV